jgi:hypothetical protein
MKCEGVCENAVGDARGFGPLPGGYQGTVPCGVKWPEREARHSPAPIAEVKCVKSRFHYLRHMHFMAWVFLAVPFTNTKLIYCADARTYFLCRNSP